jgi:hypothetical protein
MANVPMPKATVSQNYRLVTGQYYVGLARQSRIVEPEPKTLCVKALA